MAVFEIITEREQAGGWSYRVQTPGPKTGKLHQFNMQLSWADYNHWSATGNDTPQSVAEAVLSFLLDRLEPHDLPNKFDASLARRRFDDADQLIPSLIRR